MVYEKYRAKVAGCYTGKAVGGTLGMPFEGDTSTRQITYYDPVPDRMLPNDDLDLQVIDLEIIRRFGLPVNRHHLTTLWEHLQDGGPDEYGAARWNFFLGRYAPLSGYYCNKFYAGMGAAIRSELWACLAPGEPELAARLAREDSCTDHYADGMEACVFLSVVESAAFLEERSDDETAGRLISLGLSYIPESGRLASGIRYAVECVTTAGDPYAARERFLKKYEVQNWTDVTINLGLIVIAWLSSGGDFDRAICTAAGLGYDTDCTCATLGSIIGIIAPGSIGGRWTKPIGDRLILSTSIMGMHEPETVSGFCDLVAGTAVRVLEYYGGAQISEVPDGLPGMHSPWTSDSHAVDRMESPREALIALTPLTLRLVYPEYVAVRPCEASGFRLVLRNPAEDRISGSFSLNLPDGWKVLPDGKEFSLAPREEAEFSFDVIPSEMTGRRARDNDLDIDFRANGVGWTVTADLPVAVPWERTDLETGETVTVDAREVFQTVPSGRYRYRTAVKVNPYMPVCFAVMSERPFRARLNGREVLTGDGSFYVPAYHRGKTTALVTTDKLFGCWNFVEIEIGDGEPGEMFFGMARPHNCCEWLVGLEYSLKPLEWFDKK